MRTWVRPMAVEEDFTANQCVANGVCITGTIQCAYPGNGARLDSTNGKTNVFDDYNGQESGWYKDSDGMLHGSCGEDGVVSFSTANASGFEYRDGKIAYNRPISNIKGYQEKVGTYFDVTWDSTDGAGTYHHIGRLTITNVDNNKPNHS